MFWSSLLSSFMNRLLLKLMVNKTWSEAVYFHNSWIQIVNETCSEVICLLHSWTDCYHSSCWIKYVLKQSIFFIHKWTATTELVNKLMNKTCCEAVFLFMNRLIPQQLVNKTCCDAVYHSHLWVECYNSSWWIKHAVKQSSLFMNGLLPQQLVNKTCSEAVYLLLSFMDCYHSSLWIKHVLKQSTVYIHVWNATTAAGE